MHKLAIRYFLTINKEEKAETRMNKMRQLDANHHDTADAQNVMLAHYLKKGTERMEEEARFERTV